MLFRSAAGPGRFVESVYIPTDDRATLCVSSQVGCKMNCLFCMTGKQGFTANLTANQILNQIQSLPENDSLTNIVFMGMVNNMVAVANHENSGLDEGSLSFNQLCEKVANYSDTKNGFLMTSSSYADASNMICMTPITADNLRKTEGDAEDHPVTIYIERV